MTQYFEIPNDPRPHELNDGVAPSEYLPAGFTSITKARADAMIAAMVKPIPLAQQAQAALDLSDKVAWRCLKAGVSYPAAWLSVDTGLRAIVCGADKTSTVIPSFPKKLDGTIDYPAGT